MYFPAFLPSAWLPLRAKSWRFFAQSSAAVRGFCCSVFAVPASVDERTISTVGIMPIGIMLWRTKRLQTTSLRLQSARRESEAGKEQSYCSLGLTCGLDGHRGVNFC